MFFSGRSKQYPNLAEYLDRKSQEIRSRSARLEAVSGIALVATIIAVVAIALASRFGLTNITAFEAIATGLVLNSLVWIGVASWLGIQHRHQLKNPSPERLHQQEAEKICQTLTHSMQRRRLHREVDEGAAALLEEATRGYMRIINAFELPFWRDAQLPTHWRAVKEQSMLAADSAMDELLVLLKGCIHPGRRRGGLEEVVEDVMDGLQIKRRKAGEVLPSTFEPARELAEKIGTLAGEVERATREVAGDKALTGHFTSGAAIDMALFELQTVQNAENELKQGS
jgi:hypothetical protein